MQSEIRRKLLQLFSEEEGKFVSGQLLSERLGCSRTAVWKHIEDLRNEGYQLEAVQRKGYRILERPDKISGNEVLLGLKTNELGRRIHYEESLASTQKLAHRLAYEGANEGTIVIAEEQVAGRGRLDRNWFSPKFSGIWFSLILRPRIPPQQAPQLTLLAAVGVVRGIKRVTGIDCDIKWPNDILINGKKTVGILTELQAEADRVNAIIIGVGINVNQQSTDFTEEIEKVATSLRIEKGEKCNRAAILQGILFEMEELYQDYLENGFSVVKAIWESYAVSIGKHITARTINGAITGLALGITNDGVLLLRDEYGKIHHIYSADIDLHTPNM